MDAWQARPNSFLAGPAAGSTDDYTGFRQLVSADLPPLNPTGGAIHYVNTAISASGDGASWPGAYKTMAEAVAGLAAGDMILLKGSLNEAAAITGLSGISIVGAGPSSNMALWTAPDTTAPCLTITDSPDCAVLNIRFRPPVSNAGISLIGTSHQFRAQGCRFQGKLNSHEGILTDGQQSNVKILDNEFYYLNKLTNGHAIRGMTYAADVSPSGWILKRNIFHSNTQHIVCQMRQSVIHENIFAGKGLMADGTMNAPAQCIDISGAIGGCNIVTKNILGGAYTSGLYIPGTDDIWYHNSAPVTATTAPVYGLTILPPA